LSINKFLPYVVGIVIVKIYCKYENSNIFLKEKPHTIKEITIKKQVHFQKNEHTENSNMLKISILHKDILLGYVLLKWVAIFRNPTPGIKIIL